MALKERPESQQDSIPLAPPTVSVMEPASVGVAIEGIVEVVGAVKGLIDALKQYRSNLKAVDAFLLCAAPCSCLLATHKHE